MKSLVIQEMQEYYYQIQIPNITVGSNERQSNESTTALSSSTKTSNYKIAFPIGLFIAGALGNILALIVLARARKEHQRSIFYRLVGGLAGTDIIGILATSPVAISVYFNDLHWEGGQRLCDYFSFLMIFSGFATVFIVSAMALERYLAICHPYFYNTRAYPMLAFWILLAIWIISFVIATFPLFGFGHNTIQHPGNWCFFDSHSTDLIDQIFAYFYAVIGLAMVLFTIICNLLAMISLMHSTGTLQTQNNYLMRMCSTHSTNRKRREQSLQMLLLLFGIVIIFAVCWAPLMIRVIINQTRWLPINKEADLLGIRLACFNQVLDPWVYILFRKEIVMRVLDCVRKHIYCRSCRQDSETNITQPQLTHL
ncbi:PTGER4 [Acanthosepion pharaonis]|uniref:Thromboxane A2 receptor n=1 Tax=Acanthosepion pharaonis TaxID=158019 RepID=A0A812DC27_ACAPH|nr:PTGER4 [Sepia pharaonis]